MTRLAETRHSACMTLYELADAANVPCSTLGMIECGKRQFNRLAVASAVRIANALGVDVTDLMEPGWDK